MAISFTPPPCHPRAPTGTDPLSDSFRFNGGKWRIELWVLNKKGQGKRPQPFGAFHATSLRRGGFLGVPRSRKLPARHTHRPFPCGQLSQERNPASRCPNPGFFLALGASLFLRSPREDKLLLFVTRKTPPNSLKPSQVVAWDSLQPKLAREDSSPSPQNIWPRSKQRANPHAFQCFPTSYEIRAKPWKIRICDPQKLGDIRKMGMNPFFPVAV